MEDHGNDELPSRILFFEGLVKSSSRIRIWVMLWLLFTVLAAVQAVPTYAWVSDVGRTYEPGSLIHSFDANFRFDQAEGIQRLGKSASITGALLLFVSMLLGVFIAGGWLQVFLERTEGHAVRRFFYGGARYFWRFFRLLLLFLLVNSLLGWLAYGQPWKELVLVRWMGLPDGNTELLDSELTHTRLIWAQSGLMAVLFGLTVVWAIFTRTRMAAHDSRSVLWNGLTSFFFMLRHPIRTVLPMLMILFTQALVVVGAFLALGWVTRGFDEGTTAIGVGLAFLIAQVLPLVWSQICRGARYHVAVQVTKEFAPSLAGSDPWKSSIGGPGGPRYPLDGDDYGVAL